MKKLLSIMLVLLMALSVFACANTAPAVDNQPTEAPVDQPVEQPTEAPAAPTAEYAGIALQIKNKTGVTINEMYIYPAGEEMGNSVVEAGWQDKDVDPDGYEKFIYIVREPGKEMEVTVVFEDGTKAVWQVGTLVHYDELSLKNGTDVVKWEHEPVDKDEDKAACDLAAALGKTADNFYPGYELLPIEFKNKTGKAIAELYFYEENGDPKAYNNLIDYLYTDDGVKMDTLMSGKAKEGGKYLFKCFIRPHAENYMIDVVFDDGATITYPIEGWFKADADGHLPNEISLKNAEDPDDIKVQYDDGVPEPIDYLAEALQKGLTMDQWYPSYTDITVDAETLEAAKAELAKIPVPAPEEGTEPAVEEPTEPAAPAAAVPEGYTGLHLMLKNKSGREIYKVYLFPTGEDKGKNIFKTVHDENIPTEDESVEGKPHEVFAYVFRETDKLGAMTLKVRYADDSEEDYELAALEDYTVFTIKDTMDGFKQKVSDDAEDMAAMDAVAAAGVSTDGVEYGPVETAAAEVPAGYTAIHLMLKNKSGKEIYKVYLFPTGEDKGKNIFKTVVEGNIPTEDESVEGKPHEVFAYVFRETEKLGAMTLKVRYADDSEQDFELNPLEDYTVFTVKADEFKQKVSDDAEDIAAMDAVAAAGVSTDGVEFEPIA